MHVKPWLMTGAVAVIGAAAVSIIIIGQTPSTAETALKSAVWAALALTVWGVLTTFLLLARVSLPKAVAAGVLMTMGAFAMLLVWRRGYHDFRLLGALLFATLVVSVVVSWRLRAPHAHG